MESSIAWPQLAEQAEHLYLLCAAFKSHRIFHLLMVKIEARNKKEPAVLKQT